MTTTEERVRRGPSRPDAPPSAGSAWRRQWWVLPLGLYCVAFAIYGGGRFVTFDPSLSFAVARPNLPWHYPLLAVHVLTGAVAVGLAWLQVWPWLRDNHRVVHRRIGWVYYLAGVFPSGLLAFPAAMLTVLGQGVRYAMLAMATLWAITTVAGFLAAMRGDYEAHRRWMIRNVAMTTSTITVRLIQPLTIGVTHWFLGGTYAGQEHLVIVEGAAAGLWFSFGLHLMFAEWVVLRPRRRPSNRRVGAPARRIARTPVGGA